MPRTFRLIIAAFFLSIALPAAAQTATVDPQPTVASPSSHDHIRGRKNAPVAMIVYMDLECPFCKNHHDVVQSIFRKYRGKVSVIYRNFPLDFHAFARPAAVTAECVAKRKGNAAFWSFVDSVFQEGAEQQADIALRMELTAAQRSACGKSPFISRMIDRGIAAATAGGVSGTPTTFLYSRKTQKMESIVGAQPMEEFTKIIDGMLAK